jgi:hypothetical protein
VPGIDSNGLTVEEAYDEQAAIASHDQSTVQIISRTVDTEEENRILCEKDQLRHSPIVTPVVATNRDLEKGDEKAHVNHHDLPKSDDPKCGPRGRRWFAMGTILLIVVAITVALVVVLPPEPTPSGPTTTAPTAEPTTTAPTAEPTTTQNPLSELLSSASSDEVKLDFSESGLNGTIPTEIGKFTNLSEYYCD